MQKTNLEKPVSLNVGIKNKSYDIIIGKDLLKNFASFILSIIKQKNIFIVTDENVAKHHLKTVESSLQKENIRYGYKILPAGEKTKSFHFFEETIEEMLEKKCERSTTIIALGGGVVGDITGFCSACLLRGVDFIQVPTTLLAQVDSSVGGKTGINSKKGKNLVGAFYQPKLVITDIKTLDTLEKRQVLAGYAEIVKYGLLGDKEFFKWCELNGKNLINGDYETRQTAIYKSCLAKAKIVKKDEKENNIRALLNLGHTFAHSIEKNAGYDGSILHGQAVAIGMLMAIDLSITLGFCKKNILDCVVSHFIEVGLPTKISDIKEAKQKTWNEKELVSNMYQDKKVKNGKINFILIKEIGKSFICDNVATKEVEKLFKKYI